MIQDFLKKGIPVMVAWNDWGGHWQVIIGYDTMGTETTQDDVLIVADSYDTTDHNQDGYGIYPAERFYYNWTMYDFFSKNWVSKIFGGLNFRGQFRGLNFEGHFRGINPKRNRWHSSVSFSIMFYWLCFCEGGNHGSFLSI